MSLLTLEQKPITLLKDSFQARTSSFRGKILQLSRISRVFNVFKRLIIRNQEEMQPTSCS